MVDSAKCKTEKLAETQRKPSAVLAVHEVSEIVSVIQYPYKLPLLGGVCHQSGFTSLAMPELVIHNAHVFPTIGELNSPPPKISVCLAYSLVHHSQGG